MALSPCKSSLKVADDSTYHFVLLLAQRHSQMYDGAFDAVMCRWYQVWNLVPSVSPFPLARGVNSLSDQTVSRSDVKL